MEPTLSSETSAYNNIQTPGKFPEDYTIYSHHGESLKTTRYIVLLSRIEPCFKVGYVNVRDIKNREERVQRKVRFKVICIVA
jgi:hypothetical protein